MDKLTQNRERKARREAAAAERLGELGAEVTSAAAEVEAARREFAAAEEALLAAGTNCIAALDRAHRVRWAHALLVTLYPGDGPAPELDVGPTDVAPAFTAAGCILRLQESAAGAELRRRELMLGWARLRRSLSSKPTAARLARIADAAETLDEADSALIRPALRTRHHASGVADREMPTRVREAI